MQASGSSSFQEKPPVSPAKKPGVTLVKCKFGFDQYILKNLRGASVRVSLHGGQVLSWKSDSGVEMLFISSKAYLRPPNQLRGGIQIFFPQFGPRGKLKLHGFARNKMWAIEEDPPALSSFDDTSKVYLDLLLKASEEESKTWPHIFEFRLRVSLALDGSLTLIPRIRNIGPEPFSYNVVFHTHFSISDISEIRIEGLETRNYLDILNERERCTDQGDAITFEGELNRVYIKTSNEPVAILDHERKRTYVIKQEGLPDVFVWNPWEQRSKETLDLGNDDYRKMVCVGGAAIENPITLKPYQEWTGKLNLSLLLST